MSNAIVALILFIAALGGLALFYVKLGKLSFWKLAIIPGHFRILGLDNRIPTLIVAVIFWGIGFALSNVAA